MIAKGWTAVLEALQYSKRIKAWYMDQVNRRLEIYDMKTTRALYSMGALPPCFPLPVTTLDADIAVSWLALSTCLFEEPFAPCAVCIEDYLDNMECIVTILQR